MKATALLSPMLRASVTCHSASVSREDVPVERRYGLERQETRPPQSGSAQGLARGSSLLFEGKPSEAEALEEQKVMGVPNRQPPYQPLGNLTIEFSDHDNATDYRRELNLATGVARVTYRIGNATCTREVSSSAPDQALVVRLACDQPGQLSFHATLTRSQDSQQVAADNVLGSKRATILAISTLVRG
jgi:hypothetical protein